MSEDTSVPARATVRVPFQADVVVEFDRFSGFLAETSANLSLGGMFLTTRYLKPVGSELQFEVRLKDAAPLIRGRGVVAWTRWQDQGPRRPAGMGVRFVELDADSRELIYKIVEERLKSGQVGEELALDTEALRAAEVLPDLGVLRALPPVEIPAEAAMPDLAADSPETPPLAKPPTTIEPAVPEALKGTAPVPPPEVATVLAAPVDSPPLADIVARASASWSPEPPRPPVTAPAAAQPAVKSFVAPAAPRPRPRRTPWVPIALGAVAAVVLASGWWWAQRSTGTGSPPVALETAPPAAGPPPVASAPEPLPIPSAPLPDVEPAQAAADSTPQATAAPVAVPVPRFTRLERVTWVEGSGTTDLALWLDGSIPDGSFQRTRIEGREPRELIKLRGAKDPFLPGTVEVGTPEVRRVRTGFHAGGASSELHVVLDLAAGARVEATRVEGQALHLMIAFR